MFWFIMVQTAKAGFSNNTISTTLKSLFFNRIKNLSHFNRGVEKWFALMSNYVFLYDYLFLKPVSPEK